MAMIEDEVRNRQATCPTHGRVSASKRVPKLKFPFVITGVARGVAMARPFRCPHCGARVS
jgi:hypothetical protein